jgi:18S rRNA (guanine1575-N7)-methyltransferase
MARPEHQNPPELFYGTDEASKYTSNTRIIAVQAAMAARCLELLALPPGRPSLLLDVGCGSGLSGDAIEGAGHSWVGVDVSPSMLEVAVGRGAGCGGGGGRGDVLLGDMGQGFGFRAGTFDGAVSVSALQWLCYSDRRGHRSGARLEAFFCALYRALRRGARAALQFYPESQAQVELITAAAQRSGFTGGLVVDFPQSTKMKKYYLVLFAGRATGEGGGGGGAAQELPAARTSWRDPTARSEGGKEEDGGEEGGEEGGDEEFDEEGGGDGDGDDDDDDEEEEDGEEADEGAGGGGGGGAPAASVPFEGRRGSGGGTLHPAAQRRKQRAQQVVKKFTRKWVVHKKEAQRRRGVQEVRPDTRYTGRKRRPKF